MVWSKMYNLKFIKYYNLRFDENLHRSEDMLFNLSLFSKIGKVETFEADGYYYRNEQEGLSRRKYDFIFFKNIIQRMQSYLRHFINDEDFINDLISYQIGTCFKVIYYSGYSKDERVKFLTHIGNNYHRGLLNIFKDMKFKGRVCYFLLRYRLYSLFDSYYKSLQN